MKVLTYMGGAYHRGGLIERGASKALAVTTVFSCLVQRCSICNAIMMKPRLYKTVMWFNLLCLQSLS